MDTEAAMVVTASVVALVQLAKRVGVTSRYAPLAVFGFALLGVLMWGLSQLTFNRTQLFSYFAAWIQASAAAIGAYEMAKTLPLIATLAGPGDPKPAAGDVEVSVTQENGTEKETDKETDKEKEEVA